MENRDTAVVSCPMCESELEIYIRAEVTPGCHEDVSVLEAVLCDYIVGGRAFYHCDCGYQELLDPEAADCDADRECDSGEADFGPSYQ